jgi:hypothetical protein
MSYPHTHFQSDLLYAIISRPSLPKEHTMTTPAVSPDLDALRMDIAKFLREIILENYHFSSGQKETYEITPIYERYGHLASKDLAGNILERWDAAITPEEKKSYKHFFHIAFFGYLGNLTKEISEAMMKRQNEMKITLDGEEIPYQGIFPRLMNEPDKDKRKAINDLTIELEIELNEFRMDAWRVTNFAWTPGGFPIRSSRNSVLKIIRRDAGKRLKLITNGLPVNCGLSSMKPKTNMSTNSINFPLNGSDTRSGKPISTILATLCAVRNSIIFSKGTGWWKGH